MPVRLTIVILLSIALFVGFGARSVLAHGALLRGTQVNIAGGYHGATGDCTCETQWYTIGVNPGRLQIGLTMGTPTPRVTSTYSISATLFRGLHQLGTTAVSCDGSSGHCGQSLHLSARVHARGVYYLLIQGMGGHNLPYGLRIRGNVFPMHCGKYCS